jgi:hypothetical protein
LLSREAAGARAEQGDHEQHDADREHRHARDPAAPG